MPEENNQSPDNFEKQYNSYFTNAPEEEAADESATHHVENENTQKEASEEAQTDFEIDLSQSDDAQDEDSENEEQTHAQTSEDENSEDGKTNEVANNLKAALREERNKRQDLDRQFKQMQGQNKQMQEALSSLLNPQQQQQDNAAPNYDDDPLGYLKWQQEQITRQQQEQQQYQTVQQQQQQAYQTAVSLNNEYLQEKETYAKQNPEFNNSAKFLEDSVLNEYKALGYSPQEAQQLLVQDKISLLSTAKQKQISAPELVMRIAQARGYRPSAQQSKLDSVKQGMKKSKSLGTAGGESAGKKISLEELSNLNDNEFNKVFEQFAKDGG